MLPSWYNNYNGEKWFQIIYLMLTILQRKYFPKDYLIKGIITQLGLEIDVIQLVNEKYEVF